MRIKFPILNLDKVTLKKQVKKVSEECMELKTALSYSGFIDDQKIDRIASEAFDIIQAAVGVLVIAQRYGIGIQAANREHCRKLRGRGWKSRGTIELEVDEHEQYSKVLD